MKKITLEEATNTFLRTYNAPFTLETFHSLVKKFEKDATEEDAFELLCDSLYAYQIRRNVFLTSSAAFTGVPFSFRPRRLELEKKVLVAGQRVIPYTDPVVYPSELTFLYNRRVLKRKVVSFPRADALSFFTLFGPEYALQKILQDPANKDLGISEYMDSEDENLPKTLTLTAFDATPIFEQEGLSYGDRILCTLIDWDKSIVELTVQHTSDEQGTISKEDIERKEWSQTFENSLIEVFENAGPCNCTQEQLTLAFLNKLDELAKENCLSIEECLADSKKIAIAEFGVETRFWKKGEVIPAVGIWNMNKEDEMRDVSSIRIDVLDQSTVDSFLMDMVYCFLRSDYKLEDLEEILETKTYKTLIDDIINLITFANEKAKTDKQIIATMKHHFTACFEDFWNNYDGFLNYKVAPVRHKACILFDKVYTLTCETLLKGVDVATLPAQNVIVLRQLSDHLVSLFQLFQQDIVSASEEAESLDQSIDGMNESFEEVSGVFKEALQKSIASTLTVS